MLTEFVTAEEVRDLNIDMHRWAALLRREWDGLGERELKVRAQCAEMIEGCLPARTDTQVLVLAAAVEYVHDELEALRAL